MMRSTRNVATALAFGAVAAGLCACGGNVGSAPSTNYVAIGSARAHRLLRAVEARSSSKIQHIVIIIQENRTLNNLFYGFPGAKTVSYGYDSRNEKIKLEPIPLNTTWDLEHNLQSFLLSCNGTGSIPGTNCRMNGFNRETVQCGQPGYPQCPYPNPMYAYVPQSQTVPYFDIAKQYVLADEMYESNLDSSSFVSHQYIIAAQAEKSVNYPPNGLWGCEGGSGDTIAMLGPGRQFPDGYEPVCFSDTTIGQEADGAGISWAYYTAPPAAGSGIWNAYQANKYVYYGSDWTNDVITPATQFFTDVSNGNLRQISWITPLCKESDHAGCGTNADKGPSWVASLINAIGQSKYWDSTAVFVFWDDSGGWYDSEPPAYLDYDGLGIRVPLLVVSAYAKQGYVSHVHYEHGSILKFAENVFGLPALSASDTRATSPASDCFNFNQAPRKFQKISSPFGKEFFIHQRPDSRPVDTE